MDGEKKRASVFTDGGLVGSNPGRGGYAAIVRVDGIEREVTGGFAWTTNNRVELMAVIAGLESLPDDVNAAVVVTDSRYVADGIRWSARWARNGWRTRAGATKNRDLWIRLRAVVDRIQLVEFRWVRGHAGHVENERCDALAAIAASSATAVDAGYDAMDVRPMWAAKS